MSMTLIRLIAQQLAPFALTLVVLLVPAGQPSIGASADLAYSQGRLWKVTGESDVPSYVFGTMHVSETAVTDLPDEIREAFEASSLLMVELIFDQRGAEELMGLIKLDGGRRLYDILGADLFTRVADRLEELGPASLVNRLEPWAVALMLSLPNTERATGSMDQPILDMKLQQEAVSRGADVVALESFREQLAPFMNLSEAEIVAFIESNLTIPYWRMLETYEKLRDAYLEGDLAALYRISAAPAGPGMEEVGEKVWQALIDLRNDTMVERMEDEIAAGGAFVAVGALHLPGERGILQQLAERGYRVEPVR